MDSDKTMVAVPSQVLQSLIWNLELNFAGEENASAAIEAALSQAEELQKYLTPSIDGTNEDGDFSFDDFDNVVFANFCKRNRC